MLLCGPAYTSDNFKCYIFRRKKNIKFARWKKKQQQQHQNGKNELKISMKKIVSKIVTADKHSVTW